MINSYFSFNFQTLSRARMDRKQHQEAVIVKSYIDLKSFTNIFSLWALFVSSWPLIVVQKDNFFRRISSQIDSKRTTEIPFERKLLMDRRKWNLLNK